MSLTGDNTAKFWASLPTSKALGHRRRSSSSGLFNINITEPLLNRYKHLAKLHSDSSALGLNAVNKPSLPKGTLFRSSLPATPLASPMYPSFMHHFTEKTIQDLLIGKCSTPKGFKKSSSDYELKLNAEEQATPKTRINMFDLPTDQNIITRGSLLRPKTLDFKNKIKLDTTRYDTLGKINENGKLEETKDAEMNKCSLSTSVYSSIKEEQEENDNEPLADDKDSKLNDKVSDKPDEKPGDKPGDKPSDKPSDKLNSLDDPNNSAITNNEPTATSAAVHNSTIIVPDDSPIANQTVQKLGELSINEKNRQLEPRPSNGTGRKPVRQHNGLHKNNEEPQQNCLFVTNLPSNVGRLSERGREVSHRNRLFWQLTHLPSLPILA